jgi:integrase
VRCRAACRFRRVREADERETAINGDKIAGTFVAPRKSITVTEFRRPFTANGFGNKMRDWCNQAGLPHCSAHGLRKAMAVRLAELGASEHEIMAVTGHRTSKEVGRYTRAARQKVLADSAMQKLATAQTENKPVPLQSAVAGPGTKRSEK